MDEKIIVKGEKGELLYCPPHHLPHKLPFTKPITDELCHFHKSRTNMLHHIPFCFMMRCPHFNRMMKEYKKWKKHEETI